MTDSLEARRAALVENLTRLGYTQTDRVEYGQWWDGATSDGGVLVLNADKLDSPDADHAMVRAERYIAPLLAIEAAAFARGVESRPPVDVGAALDEWLDELDGSGHTAEVLAQGDRSPFGRLELLGLIRTVTTRED